MPASTPFDHYLLALRKTAVDQKTEHTDRAALEALLQALAEGAGGGFAIQHEPKRDIARGAPDFKVARKGLIIGYVETKKIGDNLDKVLKSEQIAKYKALSTNIVLTDYLHFVWISPSGVQRESLGLGPLQLFNSIARRSGPIFSALCRTRLKPSAGAV